jgi:hypothetical protein
MCTIAKNEKYDRCAEAKISNNSKQRPQKIHVSSARILAE